MLLALFVVANPHKRTEELIFDMDKVLRIPDEFFISSLNTVLIQNTTTPICTTSDNLRFYGSLICFQRLGLEWLQWVFEIFSDWKFWSLHTDQIFMLACSAFKADPIEPRITLVLVAFDKVPAESKMLGNVVDTWTYHTHGYVVPWHTTVICFAEFVVL